jgi:small subunit ribosomal protein S17
MKIFTGKVIKRIGNETAKVNVERIVADPVYGKRLRRNKEYLVHDDKGASEGQIVKFVACRPYSKLKKWRIIETEGKSDEKAKKEKQSAKVKKNSKLKSGNLKTK